VSDALATLMVAHDARLEGRDDRRSALLNGVVEPSFELREQEWRKVSKKTVTRDALAPYFTEVALLRLSARSRPVDSYTGVVSFSQEIDADGKTRMITFSNGRTWVRAAPEDPVVIVDDVEADP
jgi:hypothetical protein